jgi:hypothetical protein
MIVGTDSLEDKPVALEHEPRECPRCHRAISAVLQQIYWPKGVSVVTALFSCPGCRNMFLGEYIVRGPVNYREGNSIVHRTLCHSPQFLPLIQEEPSVPDEVANVSPTFFEIYKQCAVANATGLDQVYGVGLRKALEFLVKDFAIWQEPGNGDAIKASLLGNCIQKYVGDVSVRQVAELATWLGNDETHYERRWLDKDIKDLEILIDLTINAVTNAVRTKHYVEDMKAALTGAFKAK